MVFSITKRKLNGSWFSGCTFFTEGLWLKNRNPLCHQMARFWDWKLGPAKAHYL
jgi:hypothetical protein